MDDAYQGEYSEDELREAAESTKITVVGDEHPAVADYLRLLSRVVACRAGQVQMELFGTAVDEELLHAMPGEVHARRYLAIVRELATYDRTQNAGADLSEPWTRDRLADVRECLVTYGVCVDVTELVDKLDKVLHVSSHSCAPNKLVSMASLLNGGNATVPRASFILVSGVWQGVILDAHIVLSSSVDGAIGQVQEVINQRPVIDEACRVRLQQADIQTFAVAADLSELDAFDDEA